MNPRRITFAHLLFTLAFLLGLSLRFLNLGAAPLSEAEAAWALRALQVAHSGNITGPVLIGAQPAYTLLSGATMALLGTADAMARFWPALAGSLLVLLPVFYRKQLGETAAVLMAFGLAIDPGLVTVSRQAGGPMMALAFSLLAIAAWQIRRPVIAGFLAGVALLSGPAVIMGALGLALAWAVYRWLENLRQRRISSAPGTPPAPDGYGSLPEDPPAGNTRRVALFSAGIAILVVGTLFFSFPQGLTAWISTLPAYFSGWITPTGVSALFLVAALLVFEPLPIFFAVLSGGRRLLHMAQGTGAGIGAVPADNFQAMENRERRFVPGLLTWALIALLLALLYPGRQVSDLIWVIVPLWAAAAMEIEHYLPKGSIDPISLGQGILIFLLLVLFWYTLTALNNFLGPGAGVGVRAIVLIGILALGALTTGLVSLGWSGDAGRNGLIWGITAALLMYSIAALWGAAQLHSNSPLELWGPPPATGQEDLLLQTLGDLSEWNVGDRVNIDIVSTVDNSALRWALRNFSKARFASALAQGELPSIVITPQDQEAPALTAAYRGQDFTWWLTQGWEGTLPADLTRWLTYHDAPLQKKLIILWARSDLFPGAAPVQKPGAPAVQPQ